MGVILLGLSLYMVILDYKIHINDNKISFNKLGILSILQMK